MKQLVAQGIGLLQPSLSQSTYKKKQQIQERSQVSNEDEYEEYEEGQGVKEDDEGEGMDKEGEEMIGNLTLLEFKQKKVDWTKQSGVRRKSIVMSSM
ncbi:MAG: hypothetical protein EZS28_007199 [Streblomastix strix]|uniref:Uncharacterized protein n=1 Tax=Streblomastix strix TaxID=222440 RepID=A0A5J4WS83_9EUKA|nr:MAG: hypothetical protein EZS28_007199 [Streblomastix strix]